MSRIFLDACRCQPTDRTPIWLMRQAGRYMAEYRALREKYTILEMIKTPELAMEVTLQPIDAFAVDAAIIFADILPLLEPMGLELEFIKGEGPVFHNPIDSADAVERLKPCEPAVDLGFTMEAIGITRKALPESIPLIGFSGAPFTLACYAVEGGSSRTFEKTRALFTEDEATWHRLMEKIAIAAGEYLRAQIEAGAEAVQLFDSWINALTPDEYRRYVAPHSKAVLDAVADCDVPTIHFSTAGLETALAMAEAGGDVVGLGPAIDLREARQRLGGERAIQGNLEPNLLADGPVEAIEAGAARVLEQAEGRPGHIFNLGHGVLKHTPVDHVRALIDYVHGASP
ncbi:MAG: uroporphyrinogen decarboxylase [Verrucomicrobiota bacterium]